MGLDMYMYKTVKSPSLNFTSRGIEIIDTENETVDIIEPVKLSYITLKNGNEIFVWDILKNTKNTITISFFNSRGTDNIKINKKDIVKVKYQVAYWRKANQIHKWFVDNVQGGIDDCGSYKVTYEQVRDLIDTCNTVLNSPNKVLTGSNLLETQAGFFFGSTEYDEYYFNDIAETVSMLCFLKEGDDLEYTSSW